MREMREMRRCAYCGSDDVEVFTIPMRSPIKPSKICGWIARGVCRDCHTAGPSATAVAKATAEDMAVLRWNERSGEVSTQTTRYLPEEWATLFDDDDNEVELDPPRQCDAGGAYYCEACNFDMCAEWFDEWPAEDGCGYKYRPLFRHCPRCGLEVVPCFGARGKEIG